MDNLVIWQTFIPVLLTLILILITRRTVLSLLTGAVVGSVFIHWSNLGKLFPYLAGLLWESLVNPWHYSALFFTLALGGFASLLQASGGLERLFKNVTFRQQLERRTFLLGILCFFDGLASSLLVGRVASSQADRVGVSREKIAYIADTTSSAIACLAPISTWGAMQLGLIHAVLVGRGLEVSPYEVFLKSIPFNFYCLFSLVLVAGLTATGKDFFSMKRTRVRGSLDRIFSRHSDAALWHPLVAIGGLLLLVPTLFYVFEADPLLPFSLNKLRVAMGGDSGPQVLFYAGIGALVLALLCTSNLRFLERLAKMKEGVVEVLSPLLVLLCAWLFGGVLKDLGMAETLGELFKDHLSLKSFPCMVFLVGCFLSFTTGSSWGTMALLFPLTFGVLGQVPDQELLSSLPLLVGALLSGAVFGDHCSPFSDTTIVSSIGAGCTPYDHVKTQLPYALIAGGAAAGCFFMMG